MRRLSIGAAVVAFAAACPLALSGQRPEARPVTFSKDIAPIVFTSCASCHRPGEVAPFSLLTYRDARPWAKAIKQQVEQRRMPPWNADPHFGEFSNTRRITDAQIATIVAWVDAG